MQFKPLPHALSLGLISAIGLFAIDVYLPALPSIARDLHANSNQAQLSLTTFFIALAMCQIFYGPTSDMIGRKRPLYFGMFVFIIGSVGCALAPNIETLNAFCFLQGVGASAGMVITRAIVRDLHTGPAAAELMSRLMLVFSVSPIVAPLTGSLIITVGDWRTIFFVMIGVATLSLLIAIFFLEETRLPEKRAESSIGGAFKSYGQLLRDPYFLGMAFTVSFGMSSFMMYVSNSSFVLIDHYGLSPMVYSLVFSVNAVAFIGMSQLNGMLSRRLGLRTVLFRAAAGFCLVMVTHGLVRALGFDSLPVMVGFFFVGFGCLGLVLPTAAVLAMEAHGRIAGTASALMGTMQFVTAAIVVAFGSLAFDGTSRPMISIIALCATIVFALVVVTQRRRPAPVHAGE